MPSSSGRDHGDDRVNRGEDDTDASDMLSRLVNLNEVVSPPPNENPLERAQYRHLSLEQTRSRPSREEPAPIADRPEHKSFTEEELLSSGFANLTEIAAPPPDENPEQRPVVRSHSLEETYSNQESLRPTRRKRAEWTEILSKELYIVSYLIIFSILGTLARLGLQAITHYPNAPVIFNELWANFGGSFFLGLLQEERWLFSSHYESSNETEFDGIRDPGSGVPLEEEEKTQKVAQQAGLLKFKKGLPLYIGMSVGFCGSFTTFSSFMRDAFLALSNDLTPYGIPIPAPRNAGWAVCAVLAVIITETAMAISALQVGAHAAILLNYHIPTVPQSIIKKSESVLVPIFAFGLWAGAAFMVGWPPHGHEKWRGQVLFALIFAPVGCLLRFKLSTQFNGLVPRFPVGTFTSNILGTLVLAMCWDLQHAPLHIAGGHVVGILSCQVLQGVQDGFCGCLTTVSTWVAELKGLERKHAYIYGLWSVIVALSGLIVIVGPVRWTSTLQNISCR